MSHSSSHPAFEFVRKEKIDALNISIEEYCHKKTKATHYHFAADNPENVFLVALRTVPMDHKGVAHILEHTALCGSKRYPVRDPFFMMIRRSLNTFMNAFTSNDWTAYPFASLNRKDFNNLLDVYLDAVFFSRLDELDFLQEGHRVEFSEADNPQTPLEYKGVVYNEMKGAMSSVSSTLWQTLCKNLFPSTTYHYNSGGDPEHIPDLTYQELIDFYKTHYHPSNAIFMTFGDIPASDHHEFFEEKALQFFEYNDKLITIGEEKRYASPVHATEPYAYDSADSTDRQTHTVMAWLLGKNTNLKDSLTSQLLTYVLLENSACILQHYLETTEIGSSPSPLCGLEDSYHELVFVCGIAGSEPELAETFEKDVLNILEEVSREGVPLERLEAILHQIELHQREIGGDGYPYGLQLILTALPSVTHRGDPIQLLNIDETLEELRSDIKNPDYIKNLVKTQLIDNPHRVQLVMTPDKQLSRQREEKEREKLASIKASLSQQQIDDIINKTQALADRQEKVDDIEILPKVGLEDIPESLHIPEGEIVSINNIKLHQYNQGTNGLVYQQLIIPVPNLDDELKQLLPLYTQCLTEVGIGDKDFREVQNWQSSVVGSISAYTSLRGRIDNEQEIIGYMVISAKALTRNQQHMSELLKATFIEARFNESARIKDIVSQNRNRKMNSITGSGHALAMNCAASRMSPLARLNENWGGMTGIGKIKALDESIKDQAALETLCKKLELIHQKLNTMPVEILSITEDERQAQAHQTLESLWTGCPDNAERLQLQSIREGNRVAWISNTQVNFCAKAYPTVPVEHDDAAALTVLGGFLRNGYLHTAIREKGGAYGSGATQDTNIAAFKFYSYRDPRISGTLEDFDKAITWMLEKEHKPDQLEEAIMGVISSLDKPSSPAGEAKHAFHSQLFGRTAEQRKAFRHKLLQVTINDLKRVTRQYLQPDNASIAVITNESKRPEVEEIGLDIKVL